jgi:mycothiol synthase
MIRDSLAGLPPMSPPAGYLIRTFRSGDEAHWEQIVAASFETPRSFQAIMREDPSFRPDRLFFVVHEENPVGTAAAWYHPLWGAQYGYLHFVGVLPDHRGRGLGYWISLAALLRFVAERRTMAALETESFRIPAVKTYLRLGFRPQITDDTCDEWHRIASDYDLPISFPVDAWITDFGGQL